MNGRFRLAGALVGALIVLVALAGCLPEAVHPLSDPDQASRDQRLLGLWSATIEDGTLFAHFLSEGGSVMEIMTVSYEDDGDGEWLAFSMFASRVGDDWYMNVKPLAESGEAFDQAEQNYYLSRYEITGDGRLTVWTMTEGAVIEDIRAGKVGGVVEEGGWVTTIRITEGTEGLTSYVRGSDPARLFGERLGEFRRVR